MAAASSRRKTARANPITSRNVTQAENQKIVKRRQSALLAAGFSIFVLHDSQRIGACIPLQPFTEEVLSKNSTTIQYSKHENPPLSPLQGGAGG
jgi:hypothetical protein